MLRNGSRLAGLLLLLAAVALAYRPVFRADFLEVWDDGEYVKNNLLLRTPDGLRRIWLEPRATPQYYPLVHTSFWMEYRAWGLKASGYHAANVALHAANAVLLWSVLSALGLPGAWLAAAAFGLHPVHVESVAWITERKNLLSGLCYLAAMLCLVRFLRLGDPDARRAEKGAAAPAAWGLYVAALVLFAGALLSKTVTATLPAAVLLLIWWRRGRLLPEDFVRMTPFFVIGGAMALVTATLERSHVGAQGPEWAFSPVDRLLIAGRAFWFYAGKIFAPLDLTFIYPRWRIDAGQWWQHLFPAALALLAAGLWLRARKGQRGGLAAVALYFVTLAPALGFVNFYPMRYSFVADHFQYLGSIAPISLAAALYATHVAPQAAGLFSRAFAVPRGSRQLLLGVAVPALVLAALGTLTWRQSSLYRDQETLARQNIEKNPQSWVGYVTLASALSGRGRIDEALALTAKSLEIMPGDPGTLNFRGVLLRNTMRYDEALRHFQEALRHDSDNAEAQQNIAFTLALRDQMLRARQGGR